MQPIIPLLTLVLLGQPLFAQVIPNPYAPQPAACPTTPFIRPATGLSAQESQYITTRKTKANAALSTWLKKINSGFVTSKLPVIGLVHSGGGYRSLLTAAGNMQAMDSRDSSSSVSGLYQALTYQTALSGGGWFLDSLAAQNWPTVSYLTETVYVPNLNNGLLVPAEPTAANLATNYAQITADVAAKQLAGYPTTPIDIYGRLLGYNLLPGADGGVALTVSGLTTLANFTAHNVPYPIIRAIGVIPEHTTSCAMILNATQYEISPYEFGSWDTGVNAFAQIAYLGSNLTTGKCVKGLDSLGFATGTTSAVFGPEADCEVSSLNATVVATLETLLPVVPGVLTSELAAVYPNPFFGYSHSPAVVAQQNLYLEDGVPQNQDDSVWALIQAARTVDVVILTDAGDNETTFLPTGIPLYNLYTRAQAQGLSKMPFIPTRAVLWLR